MSSFLGAPPVRSLFDGPLITYALCDFTGPGPQYARFDPPVPPATAIYVKNVIIPSIGGALATWWNLESATLSKLGSGHRRIDENGYSSTTLVRGTLPTWAETDPGIYPVVVNWRETPPIYEVDFNLTLGRDKTPFLGVGVIWSVELVFIHHQKVLDGRVGLNWTDANRVAE
jgi:hypothetical protein